MLYSERVDKFHERPHGQQIDTWLEEWVFDESRPNMKIRDYGCGTGRWLYDMGRRYRTIEFSGVEPSMDLLRIARHRNPKCQIEQDALKFMYESKKVNVVVCSQVLGHCSKPERELFNMYRMLNHGGMLLLTIPGLWYERLMYLKNLRSGYKSDPTIRHRWTAKQLKALLRREGFEVVWCEGLGARKFGAAESIAIMARRV